MSLLTRRMHGAKVLKIYGLDCVCVKKIKDCGMIFIMKIQESMTSIVNVEDPD